MTDDKQKLRLSNNPLRAGSKPNEQQLHYELFEAIRKGDAEAFSQYYIGFVDPLVRFLTRLIGSEEEAKEITQDIFALLWEKRESIEPGKALDGIIYGTAKNMAYRALRRLRIHSKYTKDRFFTADTLDLSADESLITQETAEMIERVLSSLPPQQRKVYEASRLEGRPLKEIAVEMGITYETARTHMKRASKVIKDSLTIFLVLFLMGNHSEARTSTSKNISSKSGNYFSMR